MNDEIPGKPGKEQSRLTGAKSRTARRCGPRPSEGRCRGAKGGRGARRLRPTTLEQTYPRSCLRKNARKEGGPGGTTAAEETRRSPRRRTRRESAINYLDAVSGCLLLRVFRVTGFILFIQFGPHNEAALWYEFRTCFYLPVFRSYNALNERVEAGKTG